MFTAMLVLLFNDKARDNVYYSKNTGKRGREWTSGCHTTVYGPPNEHTYSSREVIIYCHPVLM